MEKLKMNGKAEISTITGDGPGDALMVQDGAAAKIIEGSGEPDNAKGLSYPMAAFFLVAQMAGAGFLALPKALSNAGWAGLAMLTLFCGSVAFSGTRLSRSWLMMEERWPKYKNGVRQPYMEMAEKALGIHGRRLSYFGVFVTLGGGTTVYIILTAQFIRNQIPENTLSTCALVLIVGACLTPMTWAGTPKDFWQPTVLAVVSTVVAVVVIIIQILVDRDSYPEPYYNHPTLATFSLGFGAIVFAFSGTSIFPSIQNDMKKKSDFWKSVVVAFAVIGSLYIPVAATAYAVIGSAVNNNVLLSVTHGWVVETAIALEVINLIGTFLVSFNPVALAFEEMLKIPNNFCWQRAALRSGMVLFEVLLCLAIPDFSLILNLVGGSATACATFVLPPLIYIRLHGMKGDWDPPKWKLPAYEKAYLLFIAGVGVIGGICATIAATWAIIEQSFTQSCFTHFNLDLIKNTTDVTANTTDTLLNMDFINNTTDLVTNSTLY
ncbi:unnamed protein product [Meganyctiphanes norvegica]|uniref:Amino acid transporter transmembrane domain-containing protein n=1 Tax=Meganyctiphanes norvegica TaxID=48144 RepID=A0AAV2Q7Q4_MEGNR